MVCGFDKKISSQLLKSEDDLEGYSSYFQAIVHYEYLSSGQTVDRQYFLTVLKP